MTYILPGPGTASLLRAELPLTEVARVWSASSHAIAAMFGLDPAKNAAVIRKLLPVYVAQRIRSTS